MSRRRPQAADEFMRELEADPAWQALVEIYRSTTDSSDLQQGLAVAMAGTVTDETVDDPELGAHAAKRLERRRS